MRIPSSLTIKSNLCPFLRLKPSITGLGITINELSTYGSNSYSIFNRHSTCNISELSYLNITVNINLYINIYLYQTYFMT